MKPSSRRRVEREIRDIMRRDGDHCSLCRREFAPNDRTFGGVTSTGEAALVGSCCEKRLSVCILQGLFMSADLPGADQLLGRKPTSGMHSPEEVERAIAAFQSVGEAHERRRSDLASRAGINPASTKLNTDATAWKAADAAWFASHPSRSHRLRSVLPGEEGAIGEIAGQQLPLNHEVQVIVRQVEPGARVRLPFARNLAVPVPDEEEVLHALFDLLSRGANGKPVSTTDVMALIQRLQATGRA